MTRLTILLIEGHAATGALGVRLATSNIYDVVLLDLNLPDIDGLQVTIPQLGYRLAIDANQVMWEFFGRHGR